MASYKQRDFSDCGVCCLGYVFHSYGFRTSIALLRQKAGTNKQGTTALGLVETAKAFGMEAKGIKCPFESLGCLPLPAIAHVTLDHGRQHYVVVCAVKKSVIVVMDPADGKRRSWLHSDFRSKWTNVAVILAPGTAFGTQKQAATAFQRLCELLMRQRRVLLQAFVGAVLATILSLSGAIFVQKIVDNVLVDGNRQLLNLLGLAMIAVLVVRVILSYFQSFLVMRAAQKIDVGIVLGYYRHLLQLPQSFFDTMRIGEINSRLSDAIQIRTFLNGTFISLILNPLLVICSFGGMFFYSARLAFLSLALIPFNVLLYLASDWRNRRYQRAIMERNADFSAQVVESMHTMPVIRGFQLEEVMGLKIESRFVRLLKTTWSAFYTGIIVNSAGTLVTQLYSILLLWVGASLVLNGELTAGQLMSCSALAGYMVGPLMSLIGMNASIRQVLVATDRLYEIMDLDREDDNGTFDPLPSEITSLCLDRICFKYPGRPRTLHDITLTIEVGKLTVLMGPSGSGKSTILHLLQRLHHVESGRILIGDNDIEYISLKALRKMIAILPQRIDLISGTVLENLAPADSNPDIRRLTSICRDVGILDFIESLPRAFEAAVTEGGTNLSGGQRQRLAIVRALYLDAPILLLDEPNSSLDAEADEMLIRTLDHCRKNGKTIIVAAHSRRLLRIADVLVELSDGRIVNIRKRAELGLEQGVLT